MNGLPGGREGEDGGEEDAVGGQRHDHCQATNPLGVVLNALVAVHTVDKLNCA